MRSLLVWGAVGLAVGAFDRPTLAQSTGKIQGSVMLESGTPLGGVTVAVEGTGSVEVTNNSGQFVLVGVPAGTHVVSFSLGDQNATQEGVVVESGKTTRLEKKLGWDIAAAESVTVYGASRREERIVDAPAAVTVVTEREIAQIAPSGQLPRVLETAPGVDFTQSGLYDFNFNSRGFNSSLNRRILTLIDGRDPAIGFLGSQEWSCLSFPLDELDGVELVRGPGSALYGANAFNGVLNMTSKEPRLTPGGRARLTAGGRDTRRVDARYAGGLGGDWYYRLLAGGQQSGTFTLSRNGSVEYAGLTPEAIALPDDEAKTRYFAGRLDRYMANGDLLTLEGGSSRNEGTTVLTGIGRVFVANADRPWWRANYNNEHFNLLAWSTARDTNEAQVSLRSGAELYENSTNRHIELQGNQTFFDAALRLVGGVSYHWQDIDTADPSGKQSLMAQSQKKDQQAVFAQADWRIAPQWRAVVAARFDRSDLHDDQFSPKATLVYQPTPNNTFRLTYNEAFQVPNFSEFFLQADVAPAVNLSAIQAVLDTRGFCSNNPAQLCALPSNAACGGGATVCVPLNPSGVDLGFGTPTAPKPVRVLALGNDKLELEEITSYELGYTGVIGGRLYLTADYYRNNVTNFVTDLLTNVTPTGDRINPAFGAYQPPAGLGPVALAVLDNALNGLGSAKPLLSNDSAGRPLIAAASYTNAGEVDTQGIELGLNYYPNDVWMFDLNYSWFDFEVKSQALGDQLLPNAPKNKFNLGVGFRRPACSMRLSYHWVDDFPWASGVFAGPIESYSLFNLDASVRLGRGFELSLTGSNLLDHDHYEIFGGDLLGRRVLASLTLDF